MVIKLFTAIIIFTCLAQGVGRPNSSYLGFTESVCGRKILLTHFYRYRLLWICPSLQLSKTSTVPTLSTSTLVSSPVGDSYPKRGIPHWITLSSKTNRRFWHWLCMLWGSNQKENLFDFEIWSPTYTCVLFLTGVECCQNWWSFLVQPTRNCSSRQHGL